VLPRFSAREVHDVDFLSGPKPTGTFHEPSTALVAEKQNFGSSRSARWFG
jgi:sulfide:quinone oxidoreductase